MIFIQLRVQQVHLVLLHLAQHPLLVKLVLLQNIAVSLDFSLNLENVRQDLFVELVKVDQDPIYLLTLPQEVLVSVLLVQFAQLETRHRQLAVQELISSLPRLFLVLLAPRANIVLEEL